MKWKKSLRALLIPLLEMARNEIMPKLWIGWCYAYYLSHDVKVGEMCLVLIYYRTFNLTNNIQIQFGMQNMAMFARHVQSNTMAVYNILITMGFFNMLLMMPLCSLQCSFGMFKI